MAEDVVLLVLPAADLARTLQEAIAEVQPAARVVVARDGLDALDFLRAAGAFRDRDPRHTPIVAIVDANTPPSGGVAFLRQVRSDPHAQHTPFVLVGIPSQPDGVARAYELGANSVVRLPEDSHSRSEYLRLLATYWLRISTPPPAPGTQEEPPSSTPESTQAVPVVLIADDDPRIRRIVRATLVSDTYTVVEAADGTEALNVMQTHRPRVAVLDVRMPGIDGLNLTRRAKADSRLAGMRIILLTGEAQSSDVQAGLAAGADLYLTKPFSPLQLLETVSRLAARSSS